MIVHPSPPSGSALRQRMIEDMTVRGFTEKTQHDYIRYVRTFAAFLGRSPETATAEDLRRFQLHQTAGGPTASGHQQRRRGPALLLHRDARPGRSGPPSRAGPPAAQGAAGAEPGGGGAAARGGAGAEVQGGAGHGLWGRTAGLRDRVAQGERHRHQRMLIRVEQGKGRKDRYAMLSPQLLALLRDWWREGSRRGLMLPQVWLFPGQNPVNPSPPPDEPRRPRGGPSRPGSASG